MMHVLLRETGTEMNIIIDHAIEMVRAWRGLVQIQVLVALLSGKVHGSLMLIKHGQR